MKIIVYWFMKKMLFLFISMLLSAAFFHEMWKRKEAEIEYDWDVADYEEEVSIVQIIIQKYRSQPSAENTSCLV